MFLRISIFSLVTAVSMLILSCDQNIPTEKSRSIGNTSEILVVVQNEEQWENKIGEVIREYLAQEQYGLNQSEPIFKLSHITATNFSDLFQKHRNIIIVNIDNKVEKALIESFAERWAISQQIFKITAQNNDEFVNIFKTNAETIISRFNQLERERILSIFKSTSVNKTTDKIREVTGLGMVVPMDFTVAKSEPGFLWIRKEVTEFSQGIFIIYEPYQDTAQFATVSIISRTNRFLNRFVPGPSENSFMTIDENFVEPRAVKVRDFLVDYTVEVRGIWKLENDFMGGPFVSYTFVNPNTNQIITLHGYVYKPNKEKRDLLRQVEAIIYSATFN